MKSLALVTAAFVASPALASVQISIDQIGPDVIAKAVGRLNVPPSLTVAHCGGVPNLIPDGALAPAIGAVCVGSGSGFSYSIAGPSSFGAGFGRYADSSTGGLFGFNSALGILAADGNIINSSSTWQNTSLADLGLTPGNLGTWTVSNSNDQILVVATPGPLGIMGTLGLFGWSRKLRQRIRESR